MSDDEQPPASHQPPGRFAFLPKVDSALRLFAVVVIVTEALLAVLIPLIPSEGRWSLALAMVGVLFLAIILAALGDWKRRDTPVTGASSRADDAALAAPPGIDFASMAGVLEASLGRLEENSHAEAIKEAKQGHARLLLDGLYSGALAAAEAVPTDLVDARFFGVLMSWEKAADVLRVCAFRGVFSEDVILRTFPVTGRNSGVGSRAFSTNSLVVVNSTADIQLARGEARLKAIYAIPIQSKSDAADGEVVVLCICSVVENAFQAGDPAAALAQRVQAVKRITQRINSLGRVMNTAAPVSCAKARA